MHALDSILNAVHGERIGTGHDEKIAVDAGIHRGADFRGHLRARNDLLARHVAAPLRRYLVFKEDGGHTCLLESLHGADHVSRIPVAVVSISEHRNIHGVGDARGAFRHLRHR